MAIRTSFLSLTALTTLAIALAGCKGSVLLPSKPPTLISNNGGALSGLGGAVLLKGNVRGQVVGLDGRPAANVDVHIGLIANDGGVLIAQGGRNLISENGSGVISNAGARYALAQVPTTLKTDASGRFAADLPTGGAVVVEAVGNSQLKAIQPNVLPGASKLRLQLAPTGTLTGTVSAPANPAVKDFTGVDVFVPGTSYTAKADATGAFTLTGVPAGDFLLVGQSANLGRGSVGAHVQSNERTTVAIALAQNRPLVGAIVPPVAAPGQDVEIHGDGFGATTGTPLQVTLAGAVLEKVQRVDDRTLKVTLSANATSGDLAVTAGGVTSAPVPYGVAKRLVPLPGRDGLLRGEAVPLEALAVDANDQPLGDVPATWSASGDGADLADGRAVARASGAAVFTCKLGNLSASVTLPVRDAVALPGTPVNAPTRKFGSLAVDAAASKVYTVDAGAEGRAGGILAFDARGQVTPVPFDAAGAVAREVAVAADGTLYVLASDNTLWSLSAGGKAQKLADATSLQAAIPSGPGGMPPGGPGFPPPGGMPAPMAPTGPTTLPQGHNLVVDAAGRVYFQLIPGLAVRVTPGSAPAGLPFAPPSQPGQASPAFQLATQGRSLIALLPRPNLMPALSVIDDSGLRPPVTLKQDLGTPGGMAADSQGRYYVSSASQHAIYEVDAEGGVRTLIASPKDNASDRGGPLTPGALAVDATGSTLWALDSDAPGRIWRLALERSTTP